MSNDATVALRAILKDEITAALSKMSAQAKSELSSVAATLSEMNSQIQNTGNTSKTSGEKANSSFSTIIPTVQSLTDEIGKQNNSIRTQIQEYKDPAYQDYAREQQKLKDELKSVKKALDETNDSTKTSSTNWADIAGKFFLVKTATEMAIPAIMGVVHAAADYQSIRARLTATEGNSLVADDELKKLQALAKLPGLGFEQAAQSLAGLRSMRVSEDSAVQIIDGIAKANASMGGGAEQFGRVMFQIQQGIGKGKVMAEDMNAIKEAIPNLGRLLNDSFGTSDSEELNKKLKESGKSVEDFWLQVAKMAQSLPPAGDTINNNLDNISDNWKRFKANLISSEFLLTVTGRLADFTESIAKTADESKELKEASDAAGASPFWDLFKPGFLREDVPDLLRKVKQEMEDVGKASGAGSFSTTSGTQASSSYAVYKQQDEEARIKRTQKEKHDQEEAAKEAAKAQKKIESDQKRLQESLQTRETELAGEKAYQDTIASLETQGIDRSVATVQAGADKKIAETSKRYDDMVKLAHGNGKLLSQLERDEAQEIQGIQKDATSKILTIYAKSDSEKLRQDEKNRAVTLKDLDKQAEEIKKASEKIAAINVSTAKELPGSLGKKDTSKYDLERQAIDQSAAERKRAISNEIKDEKQKAAALQAIEANSAAQKAKVDRAELEERKKNYEKYSSIVQSYAQGQLSSMLQGEFTLTKAKEAAKTAAINFVAEEATKRIASFVETLVFQKAESAVANAESIAQAQLTGAALAESYATAAALASIATMGAADVAGGAGLAATVAAAHTTIGFAGGGIQMGPAIVGERRAEVSTPTTPQRITQTSNSTVNSSMGGATININTGASVDRVAGVLKRATNRQSRGLTYSSR